MKNRPERSQTLYQASRAQASQRNLGPPRKRRAPEWITWGFVVEALEADCREWLKVGNLEYLDHTDEMIILCATGDMSLLGQTKEADAACEFYRTNPGGILGLGHLGFESATVCSRAEWYTDPDFLHGRMWRAVRYATLVWQGNWCRACGARPPHVHLHVDHIHPRSKYPALALAQDNLQVLCRDCNLGKLTEDETNWIKRSDLPKEPEQGLAARVATLEADIVKLEQMVQIHMRGEFMALERVDQLEAQLKNQAH